MSHTAVLRLYFHYGTRVKETSVWKKMWAPSLATHLAKLAKQFGIKQVISYRVWSGFLDGGPLTHDISEIPPPKLPQCVELVDDESSLRRFIKENHSSLADVRVILLKAETPLLDNAMSGAMDENARTVEKGEPLTV